ncbi:hypothetical protein D3C72_1909510 [compost metagenome]
MAVRNAGQASRGHPCPTAVDVLAAKSVAGIVEAVGVVVENDRRRGVVHFLLELRRGVGGTKIRSERVDEAVHHMFDDTNRQIRWRQRGTKQE